MRLGPWLLIFALSLGFDGGVTPATAGSGERVAVGIVVDGPWSGNEQLRQQTVSELVKLTEGEFDVTFPDRFNLVGDWSLQTAQRNLDLLLDDPEVDVVVTWGLLASHAACCTRELQKPVIAPVVVDQELQGFPLQDGASGVSNLSYVALPNTLVDDLFFFQRMVPFSSVAILINSSLLEAIPDLPSRTAEKLNNSGLDFEYVPVTNELEHSITLIPDRSDAVYVWPLFHLSLAQHQQLIDELNSRKLPTFSALGGLDLELGMLASLGTPGFLERLARRVALNIQRTLLGEDSSSFKVDFLVRDRLQINMETASKIGVSPSSFLLLEADLINEDHDAARETRTLRTAVQEAIRSNLALAAERRTVAAGEQQVAAARAEFLPHLESQLSSIRIDSDRAAASFGSQAEQSTSTSLVIDQLIYSTRAGTALAVERLTQTAREAQLEAKRLDVALEAAIAYLDVLRAKSLVQIQRNNLELTRSNLELAGIRQSVGSATASEVHRWESQIATDRKALIDALSDLHVTEINLNRVMHRPLDSQFSTDEIGVSDPGLLTGHVRFQGYTETPHRYAMFTDFMVANGLDASPEMVAIEARIRAQERVTAATKKVYWAPDFGLSARYDHWLDRSGEGSSSPPGFLPRDDDQWSIAVQGSLPLFQGGKRAAARVGAAIELEGLELELSSLAERIEQRIRSSMAAGWASFPGIELARVAFEAASKNLDLVADAYRRGAVSIIELLDAQNVALNAEQLAANSIHDFLVDLMVAERANGHFQILMSPKESSVWFDQLENYFRERGVDISDPDASPIQPSDFTN